MWRPCLSIPFLHLLVFSSFPSTLFLICFRRLRGIHHLVIRAQVQISCYISFFFLSLYPLCFIFFLKKKNKNKRKEKRSILKRKVRRKKKVQKKKNQMFQHFVFLVVLDGSQTNESFFFKMSCE